jgi:hypothetical protein
VPGTALLCDRRYAEDQRGGERKYDRDDGSLKARVMQAAAAEIPGGGEDGRSVRARA